MRLSNSKLRPIQPRRGIGVAGLRQVAEGRQAGLIGDVGIVDQQRADEHVVAGEAVGVGVMGERNASRRRARQARYRGFMETLLKQTRSARAGQAGGCAQETDRRCSWLAGRTMRRRRRSRRRRQFGFGGSPAPPAASELRLRIPGPSAGRATWRKAGRPGSRPDAPAPRDGAPPVSSSDVTKHAGSRDRVDPRHGCTRAKLRHQRQQHCEQPQQAGHSGSTSNQLTHDGG